MADLDSIGKYIQKYRDRLDFLEEVYKDNKYHHFLNDRLNQIHPNTYDNFEQWLERMEYEFKTDLKHKRDENFCYDFLYFYKRDITLFYNDIQELQGKKPYSRKVYFSSVNKWDKPYLKREVSLPTEKDYDFYSLDVTYFFRSTLKPEEARKIIKDNKKQFASDSLDASYCKLQGNKKYKDVKKEFLQIKKVLYRSKFKELRITVGLKDSILQLKEKMQDEINTKIY